MKKEVFDYSDVDELMLNREVSVGIKSNNIAFNGVLKFIDDEVLVVVVEPTSSLDIETKVVHTIIDREDVSYCQFKTEKNK